VKAQIVTDCVASNRSSREWALAATAAD